ncbi:N-6 DNA methylase [Micromonospora lupini]|uniref:Type II restriction-modification system DNA adenine-specific methylase n=1 Tax=Micromonospora lupini str. Lupac 08 TaxID=1150864 RepID=I0L1V9_9ACTN|nr:N-6 DNA methylase [Micromonospora lupini]CCH17806.1 Type II restriction-modification system DNA adenine-specific methylase [Micromonospora lupini str. Lupac 08]
MPRHAQVTAAEISRLAGVTRATVSNWRRRHPDFPAPTGGTDTSPAYDLDAVQGWLAARGQLPATSPADDLRTAMRATQAGSGTPTRLLPLVLAAARMADSDLKQLVDLPNSQLPERALQATRPHVAEIPGIADLTYDAEDAALLRALLRCVADEGALRAADALAEGDHEATSAGGMYETPAPVATLMADLLAEPGEPYPEAVFDPACGAGNLLLAAAARGARKLYGQDIVPAQAAQTAVRLALQPGETTVQVSVRAGDSIRADAFPTLTAEAVLCAPPYGDREWGHDELAYDARWEFGLPAKSESELAWLQHCFAHLAEGGRAVLLMPPATAERGSGRRLRAEILRTGVLRAVIALPPGVAQPLHVGLHLWVIERPHPQATLPLNILMVDAATLDVSRPDQPPSKRQKLDWPALHDDVLKAWNDYDRHPDNFDPVPGVAQAVPIIDLLDETIDLTPARHVRATPVPAMPDELAAIGQELRSRLRRAATGLITLSGGEAWPPVGAAPLSWRTASIADLLRGDALELLRVPAAIRSSTPVATDPSAPPTLTARDVMSHRPASGHAEEEPSGTEIEIREGDVILPELLQNGAGTARVADARDAGLHLGRHLHLLRPDPTRLDPWFLAGFLAAEENLSAASSGSTVIRLDPRRLRVPLLPLAEQRRYGKAFRQLNALRTAADIASRLADETARTLAAGLAGGALQPPGADQTPS